MKHLRIGLAALFGLALASPSHAQIMAQEYTPDSHTIVLDHMNRSLLATSSTGVQYVPGFSGLHEAAKFSAGSWARETFNPWFTGTNPVQPEGTVELWVKPEQYGTGIMTMQLLQTDTAPSSGYIYHMGISPDGKLSIGGWNGSNLWDAGFPSGTKTIPLDTWTHLAFVWSPQGSRTFINGEQDAFSPGDYYPGFGSFGSPVYTYLNYWGHDSVGALDELRISNIARTQFDTIIPASTVPEPNTVASLLVSASVAVSFCLRRKNAQ